MSRTANFFSAFMLAIIMLASCVLPVFADEGAEGSGTVYDPNVMGWVRAEVKVPEGFDKIVFFEVMDASGAPVAYQVLPENNYVFDQQLMAGPYRVNAYVHNDTMLEYAITKSVDTISVQEGKDSLVVFTVTGGPEASEESSKVSVSNPSILDGAPVPSEDSESAPDSEDVPIEGSDADTVASESPSEDIPEEMGFWKQMLIAIAGTAVFVGFVFGAVYIARRYMQLHE